MLSIAAGTIGEQEAGFLLDVKRLGLFALRTQETRQKPQLEISIVRQAIIKNEVQNIERIGVKFYYNALGGGRAAARAIHEHLGSGRWCLVFGVLNSRN